MAINEILSILDNLYEITEEDWVLEVTYILTEPVLPTINIHPEDYDTSLYAVTADTIEEGIEKSTALVYAGVIKGEPITSEYPISGDDDRKWIERLAEIQKSRKSKV